MKRFLTFVFLCFCVLLAFPKYVGDVNEDGRITIADVTALVNILLGKEGQYDSRLVDVNGDSKLSIADVTALVNVLLGTEQAHELEEESADTLFIHYGTDGPTYKLPSAWEPYVTVAINGNDVAVTNTNLTDEYVTALSGSCADGSFAYMGSFKTTLVLNGLTLTNQRGTCIDIEDGKRINLQLADGTTNSLADGTTGKAALFCRGHLEISKGGTLTVQGNVKHAISTKEYLEVKKTAGIITVAGAVGDGIHAEQYFQMNGGTIVMRDVAGDGIQAEAKLDGSEQDGQLILNGGTIDISLIGSDVAALKSDSLMTIGGGSITVSSTGSDVKALKSDADIVVQDGSIDVTQSGGYLVNEVTTNGTATYDPSYCTALKADGSVTVTGGTITVNSTADGGRGINATGDIDLQEGVFHINANGDGGTLDLSSAGSSTTSSYRLYVSIPATSGGGFQPGGQQQSAWRNVYLYDGSGTLVSALGNQKSFTVNGTTTTFYYYDFGSTTSGTYYIKSDDYTSGGGWGGSSTYTIRTTDISLNMTGKDVFYSIANEYSTSGSTRTYKINNVTSTYANASSSAEEGDTYKAFCLKADGNIMISGGELTLVHHGTMSKGIKADGTIAVSGGSIHDTAGGSYMIVGTEPSCSAAMKCATFMGSDGEVTIQGTGSASRGISTDGSLTVTGGTYDITLTGDGATYTGNSDTEGVGSRGFKSDGDMLLQGGSIHITCSARGGKGIKVGTSTASGAGGARLTIGDASATGQGPTLIISTTGSYLASESSGGGGNPWGGGGPMDSGFIGSCKAVKCMGPIEVYGGNIRLSTKTNGAEGLESKSTITVHGGTLESDAYDDAINATSTITINNGNVWAHASNNDAIDSNDGTTGIVINNGVVIASGANSPEEGFDCDNAAFILNGGTVIGTGGSQGGGGFPGGGMTQGGGGMPTKAAQAYVSLSSATLTAGTYLSLKNSSGGVICSYRIPQTTSQATVLMSSPSLSGSSSASIVVGSSSISNPVTSLWEGAYTTGATLTGGTSNNVTPKTGN